MAICASTSVREAHDRGYEVLVLGDACAEGDALSHAAALASFQLENGLLATVAPAAAFIAALGRLP
jgi:biuret amidohydrolase